MLCRGSTEVLLGSSSEPLLCASPFSLHPRCGCTALIAARTAAGPSLVGMGSERVHTTSQLVSLFIFHHIAYPLAGLIVRHHILVCCPTLSQLQPGNPQSVWVHSKFKGLFKLLQISIAWQGKQSMLH